MRREGMIVQLDPIAGVTAKGLLPKRGFTFQCPPLNEFAVEHVYDYADYATWNDGQFSRSSGRQLRVVTFDTLLVDWGLFTLDSDPGEIEDYRHKLIDVLNSGTPFLLSAHHQLPKKLMRNTGPELQMPATLRTLRVSEKDGEGDARYINVSFTEWRDAVAKRKHKGQRGGGREFPTIFRLKASGDGVTEGHKRITDVTFHKLARHYYGDPSLWRLIAKTNDVHNAGARDRLIQLQPYKKLKGDKIAKIKIPAPPAQLIGSAVGSFLNPGPIIGFTVGGDV